MPKEVIERAAQISQRLRRGLPITPFSLEDQDQSTVEKKSKISDAFLQVAKWDLQHWDQVKELINMLKSL